VPDRVARILEQDPELGQGLDAARFSSASVQVRAAVIAVARGDWSEQWPASVRDGLGVGRDGVLVPVKLTHSILAELVAARRPTVNSALSNLEHCGQIAYSPDGWLLHGGPPGELERLNILD